jgi:hypothetical protein
MIAHRGPGPGKICYGRGPDEPCNGAGKGQRCHRPWRGQPWVESQALNFMEAAMGRGCTSPQAVGQGKQA